MGRLEKGGYYHVQAGFGGTYGEHTAITRGGADVSILLPGRKTIS